MATYYNYAYYDDEADNETYDFNLLDCSNSSLPFSHIYLPILYFIMFFTGILGNVFVITVMGSRGKRGRLVDTFVVNLALADLVFVFTLPLWAVSAGQEGRWDFGDHLCKLSSYIIAVNRFSNTFFLTCMSVDRYLAVVKLMDSRYLRSTQCMRLTCAVVWLLSLALGTPSLMYRSVHTSIDKTPFCLEDEESPLFLSLSLITVFLTFALPVLIILFCYGSILTRLRQHCVATGNPRAEARRRHSLKMVFTIIVTFLVSWFPFNIFKTILICSKLSEAYLGCSYQSLLNRGLILSCCLAFLNSCVNPAIYFFLDHHFKRQAENLCLTCVGKRGLHQGYASSTSLSNNGTSESCGTTLRGRLPSFDQNI